MSSHSTLGRRRLLSLAPALLLGGCAAPAATQAEGTLTVTNAVDRARDITVTIRSAGGSDVLAETLSLGPNESRSLEFATYARSVSITVETESISNTVSASLREGAKTSVSVSVAETETGWQFDG